MGKYDSPFFNSERYFDPTVGLVLRKLAQEERAQRINEKAVRLFLKVNQDPVVLFAKKYAAEYEAANGRKKSGKPKVLGNAKRNENYIRAYLFCMENAEEEQLEKLIFDRFGICGRRVKQCFTREGDMGKLINAWVAYTEANA